MKKVTLLSFAALLITSVTVYAGTATVKITSQHQVVVVDKTYNGRYGPGGQAIFIEGKTSRYYYKDKKGHHIYVTKAQLRTHR